MNEHVTRLGSYLWATAILFLMICQKWWQKDSERMDMTARWQ